MCKNAPEINNVTQKAILFYYVRKLLKILNKAEIRLLEIRERCVPMRFKDEGRNLICNR